MRLFIIEKTTFHDLIESADAPSKGDIVAYWRSAQDVRGESANKLRRDGVDVIWAEELLSREDVYGIESFLETLTTQWYARNGRDVTILDGFSLGEFLTVDIITHYQIHFLVRFGEICRRLLAQYADTVTEIVTDIVDAESAYQTNTALKASLPRRRFLEEFCRQVGIPCTNMAPNRSVPSVYIIRSTLHIKNILRTYLGGLRPRYLLHRLKFYVLRARRTKIFIFVNNGLALVAAKLADNPGLEIITDRSIPATSALRYDHLLPIPSFSQIKAALSLRRHCKKAERIGFDGETAQYNGVHYDAIFSYVLSDVFRHHFLPTLMKLGQAKRFVKLCRPDVLVFNGEGDPGQRAVMRYAQSIGTKVVFIDHGYNLTPYGYYALGRNNPDIIYIAQGRDHVDAYGKHLPDNNKPWRPVVTNPATIMMNTVKGKRTMPHRRRILMTNFTPAATHSTIRCHLCDNYMIDIFAAAKELAALGYSITFRNHPGYNQGYVHFLIHELGLSDVVQIDTIPHFSESLLQHDVLVANVTTCVYQALFAGWPTIFYEPSFNPAHHIGLPAATDIDRPIASTVSELVTQVCEALENDKSTVARFPELFNTIYAERFIGNDAASADVALADFIVRNILHADTTRQVADAAIAHETQPY